MPVSNHHNAMTRLIEQLRKLPGIGTRSAQRIAFHLLKAPADDAAQLADAIARFKADQKVCAVCGNVSETDPCPVCADPRRDQSRVLVVEQPLDVASLEATGQFNGVYHVLMGRLAPLEAVGPGELNIKSLLARIRNAPSENPIREVILATSPTMEGDGAAMHLAELLRKLNVKVTRLARGLPTGSSLETVSKAVLADALSERREMD